MHICFLTHEFPKPGLHHGGVGTFVRNLAIALVEKGIRVSVVGTNNSAESVSELISGVRVIRVGKPAVPGLNWVINAVRVNKALRELHRQHPIDVVEGNELSLAFVKKMRGVHYVIRMHGGHHFFAKYENRPTEPFKVFQEKVSFAKSDGIVAVSRFVGEETVSLLGIRDRKVTVIYNSIDTHRFTPTGVDPLPDSVLFVGTLVEKKGVRQLVQSLEYLVDEFPELKLTVVGRSLKDQKTGVDFQELLKKEISGKIASHVAILGPVSNEKVMELIQLAEVCCYPSHMEAMPLAWLETMCLAKPFVASERGPGPELITDQVTGVLCDPLDPKSIAEGIRWMLDHKEKAKEMGLKARQFTVENFDSKVILNQNIKFYQELIH